MAGAPVTADDATAPDQGRGVARWLPVGLWVAAMSAILLWPLTRSGYPLARDMVFTARQPLDLAALGASSAAPRAVPVDAWVALAERVVDGAVVGRLALLLPLLGAGVGAAAVLRAGSPAARLAAATFAVWNPFVVERLALGQWALLWGYAALPWVVLSVATLGGRRRWAVRAVALAAGSITPTGGLVVAVSAIALGARRGRREAGAVAVLALAAQLPWLVPAIVGPAAVTSDPAGVSAFASRSERGGVLLTLLTGGGAWDADVVPGSRTGPLPWLALVVVAAAVTIGLRRLGALIGSRPARTLIGLAGFGYLIAGLAALPGGHWLLTRAVLHLPGAGLLRDGQKWLMPLVLLEALCAGAAVDRVLRGRVQRAARGRARVISAASGLLAVAALPVVLLPDAAATLRTPLRPVHYPAQWSAVPALVRGGAAAALPLGSYRDFPWAPGRTVYDPASRLLNVPTVVDDRLAVAGRLVLGDDPRARDMVAALTSGAAAAPRLAALGIEWVVVERRTPGPVPELGGLTPVASGPDVLVYRVPGPIRPYRIPTARAAAVLTADGIAAAALLGCLAVGLGTNGRRHVRTAS